MPEVALPSRLGHVSARTIPPATTSQFASRDNHLAACGQCRIGGLQYGSGRVDSRYMGKGLDHAGVAGRGQGILVIKRGPVDLDEQVSFGELFFWLVGDRLRDRIVIELLNKIASHGRRRLSSIDREWLVDKIAGGLVMVALTRQGVDDGEYSGID